MSITESALRSIADWRAAQRAGADAATLLRQRRERLEREARCHAWIERTDAPALDARLAELAEQAHGMDAAERLARWPLFGVPFAAKDNIDAAGFATTAACPAWARQPQRNATAVQRLLDAGAVLMGKTNLDQFATGLVGTRSPYGALESVLAPGRVSGGSSSGSAVVVAAGEVAFALGTDTAGSGRVPAAFNQLVGLKPTPGRVSTRGVLPACQSLDCVSIFALTAEDAAEVLAVLEGPDTEDPYSRFAPGRGHWPAKPRLAVPAQPALDATLGYGAGWQAALAEARAAGCEIEEIDFAPLHAVARLLYEGPWVAERQAALGSFFDTHRESMDTTVASIIGAAARFGAPDVFDGLHALQAARAGLEGLWQRFDALMVPSAPRHPSLAEVAAAPVSANAVLGTYTNFVNLLGWCALALPAEPVRADGGEPLPFGITLIGPAGADAALAQAGARWQQHLPTPLGGGGRASAADLAEAALGRRSPAAAPTLAVAVVGAHLSGLPLNVQLRERGAWLEAETRTAPRYRLFALPGTVPPKPGLLRVPEGGAAIALEVWRMPQQEIGSFLALVPPPLGLGSVELEDGRFVHGFLCESAALDAALDITHHGGWRNYLRSR